MDRKQMEKRRDHALKKSAATVNDLASATWREVAATYDVALYQDHEILLDQKVKPKVDKHGLTAADWGIDDGHRLVTVRRDDLERAANVLGEARIPAEQEAVKRLYRVLDGPRRENEPTPSTSAEG